MRDTAALPGEDSSPGDHLHTQTVDFSAQESLPQNKAFGTPILLNTGDRLTAVWSGGESSHLMTAQLDGEEHVTMNTGATGGELPSAAVAGGQLFVASISKSGDYHAVWLTRVSD